MKRDMHMYKCARMFSAHLAIANKLRCRCMRGTNRSFPKYILTIEYDGTGVNLHELLALELIFRGDEACNCIWESSITISDLEAIEVTFRNIKYIVDLCFGAGQHAQERACRENHEKRGTRL